MRGLELRKVLLIAIKTRIPLCKGNLRSGFLKFLLIDFKKVVCVMSVLFRSGILYLNKKEKSCQVYAGEGAPGNREEATADTGSDLTDR